MGTHRLATRGEAMAISKRRKLNVPSVTIRPVLETAWFRCLQVIAGSCQLAFSGIPYSQSCGRDREGN